MIARPANRNGGREAAAPISTVEATPSVKGREWLQNPERKAVKPVREVAHANS